jgi:acyl-[acyl-carrier-protein]-phospholipid O-acyltransferase/long-chain-fatty-acid--[acyl-carrier-protein] ligase
VPEGHIRALALAIAYTCAALVAIALALLRIVNHPSAPLGFIPITASFLAGLAAGSALVRRYSRIEVDLGWVAVGLLLTAVFCIASWLAQANDGLLLLLAGGLGAASACVLLSANAYWRPQSALPKWSCAAGGALVGAAAGALLPGRWLLPGAGLLTLVFTACLFAFEHEIMIRGGLFLGGRVISGIRVVGQHHVPRSGGALLVSNHVTFIDGFLIGSSLPRLVRFMIFKPYFELPVAHWVCTVIRAIPTSENGPREIVQSLRRAREALDQGDLVCIFAEGFITRTGEILPFKRGMDKIVAGTGIPIIPVHLDGLYGRTLSLVSGKVVLRWPQRARVPVTISFGPPLPPGATAEDARNAVEQLANDAAESRNSPAAPLVVA